MNPRNSRIQFGDPAVSSNFGGYKGKIFHKDEALALDV